MAGYQPYPKYKHSGEEWLGNVPNHWAQKQVRHVFRIHNGSTPKSGEPDYWDGDINWITPEDLGKLSAKEILSSRRKITEEGFRSCGVTLTKPGGIVVSTRAPIGHVAITMEAACVNQGCRILEPQMGYADYWYYSTFAAAEILRSKGQGTTFMELPRNALAAIKFPMPPEEEQKSIARFLDYKTAQIDALIAKKEALLEKLTEKRTALISNAVTRGLNPQAKMKDSDVEWLGEVPKHWEIMPIKFALDMPITDGPHSTPIFYDEGIPFLSAESVKDGSLDFDKKRGYISKEDHAIFSLKYKPKYGDVYMVKSGATTGKVARVKTYEEFNIWSPLAVFRPKAGFSITDFIYFVVMSKSFLYSVELSWSYGTQQNIGMGVISNIRVAIPPHDEQQAIARFIDHKTVQIDEQADKVRDAIEKLREYRSALITQAVTGKIDVRNVEIPEATAKGKVA